MLAPKSDESIFWEISLEINKSGNNIEIKNSIEDKKPKKDITFKTSFNFKPILNKTIRAIIEKLVLWAINEAKIDWLYT